MQHVSTCAAVEQCIILSADKCIVASTREDTVDTCTTNQAVVAVAAGDCVTTGTASDCRTKARNRGDKIGHVAICRVGEGHRGPCTTNRCTSPACRSTGSTRKRQTCHCGTTEHTGYFSRSVTIVGRSDDQTIDGQRLTHIHDIRQCEGGRLRRTSRALSLHAIHWSVVRKGIDSQIFALRVKRNSQACGRQLNHIDIGNLCIVDIVEISANLQQIIPRATVEQCIVLGTYDGVVTSTRENTVCTCTASKVVGTAATVDGVVARTTLDCGTISTGIDRQRFNLCIKQHCLARRAVQCHRFDVDDLSIGNIVKVRTNMQHVGTCATVEQCIVLGAHKCIVASFSEDTVNTCTAGQDVIPVAASDNVSARTTDNGRSLATDGASEIRHIAG